MPRSFDFDIQQWDDKVHVTVNGKTVVDGADIPGISDIDNNAFALGTYDDNAHGTMTFKNLQLRKLSVPPKWFIQKQIPAQPEPPKPKPPETPLT